jgi:hypothetical protein
VDRVLSPEPGTGELNVDPQFVSSETWDFTLANTSPCIDAGNPDPAFNDPDETRADIGAFYVHQTGSATERVTWSGMKRQFR